MFEGLSLDRRETFAEVVALQRHNSIMRRGCSVSNANKKESKTRNKSLCFSSNKSSDTNNDTTRV